MRVDSWVIPLVRNDRFILCSDGLVDEVDDARIAQVVAEHADPQACADALVDAANAAGGRDNTTVVVLDVLEGQEAPDYDHEPPLDLNAPTWLDDSPEPELVTAGAVHVAGPGDAPRFMTPGKFLFGLALAAIAVVSVVLGLVALQSDDSPPTTTTTTTTSTTSPPTTTTTTSSTTTTSKPVPLAGLGPSASSP